jgi:hypothetical protein
MSMARSAQSSEASGGSAEYRDLVAEDEELDVLGRRCAAEQHQPAEEPNEDQIEQT